MTEQRKLCTKCKERYQSIPGYYCYNCLAARKREWRARNPERTRAQQKKDNAKQKARLLAARELANQHNLDNQKEL